MSDTDTTFNFILAMVQSQLINLLCDRADDKYGGRLPVHVRMILDEFANIGQIPNFDKLIATIRSREISASIILQSQSQLKAIYKDAAEIISDNCDCTLFLSGRGKNAKEIADVLGKMCIRDRHKLDMLERFEGVQVTNRNALDVIKEDIQNKELADRTMYFLDSPYFENNAGYSHNMVFSKEHEEYCDLVGRLGGYKMVCGYDNPVYQKILVEKYGFYKYLVKEVAKTMRIGGGDELRAREDEFVWLSYPLKGAYQL